MDINVFLVYLWIKQRIIVGKQVVISKTRPRQWQYDSIMLALINLSNQKIEKRKHCGYHWKIISLLKYQFDL